MSRHFLEIRGTISKPHSEARLGPTEVDRRDATFTVVMLVPHRQEMDVHVGIAHAVCM